MNTLDIDTRAGLSSVLEEVAEGLAEIYGFTVEDIKSRAVTPENTVDGLFPIFALLYAIQGFLLDPDDQTAVEYLTAAALVLEPVVYNAVGVDLMPEDTALEN